MKMKTLLSIIEALERDIFSGFNINQIAKLSGVDAATTHRTLKEMESRNEVVKERKGNNVFYCLNLQNSSTTKYCELAEIEKRKNIFQKIPTLLTKIQDISKHSECAVLFGSFARGEKKPKDIDVLLLFQKKPNIREIKKIIQGTTISPLYMNFLEFGDKTRERNPVVMDIIKDAIVLYGEDVYWRLLKGI